MTDQDKSQLLAHYNTSSGYGNVYKFCANWFDVCKTLLFGWNNLSHPAQFHFSLDFDGHDLNYGIYKVNDVAWSRLAIKKQDAHILDAGCGIGGSLLYLARKHPQHHFTGVSLSPDQVNIACKRARLSRVTNVDYITADYFKLPFSQNTFDGIVAFESLSSVGQSQYKKLLQELCRVLKKGARLVVFDGFVHDSFDRDRFASKYADSLLGWSIPRDIDTAEEFIRIAQINHLKLVQKMDLNKRMLASSKEIHDRARLLYPFVKVALRLQKFSFFKPLLTSIGAGDPGLLGFYHSCIAQYHAFRSRDALYWQIVLEK